eukprot:6085519-Lingulodinium_polyedra.AAC.1
MPEAITRNDDMSMGELEGQAVVVVLLFRSCQACLRIFRLLIVRLLPMALELGDGGCHSCMLSAASMHNDDMYSRGGEMPPLPAYHGTKTIRGKQSWG